MLNWSREYVKLWYANLQIFMLDRGPFSALVGRDPPIFRHFWPQIRFSHRISLRIPPRPIQWYYGMGPKKWCYYCHLLQFPTATLVRTSASSSFPFPPCHVDGASTYSAISWPFSFTASSPSPSTRQKTPGRVFWRSSDGDSPSGRKGGVRGLGQVLGVDGRRHHRLSLSRHHYLHAGFPRLQVRTEDLSTLFFFPTRACFFPLHSFLRAYFFFFFVSRVILSTRREV